MDRLPNNTVAYSRAGVELYRRGEPFGLQGWPHTRRDNPGPAFPHNPEKMYISYEIVTPWLSSAL